MQFPTQRHGVCRWLLWAAAFVSLAAAFVAFATWWLSSRPVDPIPRATLVDQRQRAMQWLRANEQRVLADGNSALWWMLQDAGRRSGDAYLQSLTQMALSRHFAAPNEMEPWRRMLEPGARINAYSKSLSELRDYQRFFHHALTCMPLSLKDGDTSQFLTRDMCAPMLTKVAWSDPVCTTHQLFGMMFIRQTGCAGVPAFNDLEEELLDNVRLQLTWDPVMRDPHIQRLLLLALHGRTDEIKPIWLRRMLDAQEPDGGWLGHSRIPELPSWLQPGHLRELIALIKTDLVVPKKTDFDFHATAQAIFLLTILTHVD